MNFDNGVATVVVTVVRAIDRGEDWSGGRVDHIKISVHDTCSRSGWRGKGTGQWNQLPQCFMVKIVAIVIAAQVSLVGGIVCRGGHCCCCSRVMVHGIDGNVTRVRFEWRKVRTERVVHLGWRLGFLI